MGDFHKTQTFIASLNSPDHGPSSRGDYTPLLWQGGGLWESEEINKELRDSQDSSFSEHEGLQRPNKVGSQITKNINSYPKHASWWRQFPSGSLTNVIVLLFIFQHGGFCVSQTIPGVNKRLSCRPAATISTGNAG